MIKKYVILFIYAMHLNIHALLYLETILYFLEHKEISVSARKAHCPAMNFPSSLLVAQLTFKISPS